jgi:hypothetical protein
MLNGRFSPASIRTSLVASLLCFCAFLAPDRVALAKTDCIPVHGLSFERISRYSLLASREGRNIAIVVISYPGLPERLGQFRFFSANLCQYGAESKFHIDGKLFRVDSIEIFEQ